MLLAWSQLTNKDPEKSVELIHYKNLNEWMHCALSDKSEFGIFGTCSEAKFLRNWVEHLPVLIDYLSICSEKQHNAFQTTLLGLSHVAAARGCEGLYAASPLS